MLAAISRGWRAGFALLYWVIVLRLYVCSLANIVFYSWLRRRKNRSGKHRIHWLSLCGKEHTHE